MVAGIKALKDPFTLITMLIGIIILVQVVVNLFPVIMTNVVLLGAVGNFTFSSLFASAGLVSIILSAVVLISVLALIGIKTKGAGR